jgi:hypothetical protein
LAGEPIRFHLSFSPIPLLILSFFDIIIAANRRVAMSKKKDTDREERIDMEVVVDAYEPGERAMGWYYYLEDKISFPFTAKCIVANKRSPLKLGEKVTVTQMSGPENCENDMYVDILFNNKELATPLSQLKPIDADDDTDEAIADWHYWINQGYMF